MKKYFQLIRVKHWIKNFLIFIPLISAKVICFDNVRACIFGFLSFSFMSSFIYIVNDIRDIEKDRLHPKKKKRPLASGAIAKCTAIYIAVLMIILSIIINTIINNHLLNASLYFLLSYMIINFIYSFGLKNVAIIDVILLATGFVIRVYYGAAIIGVKVSSWLFLTIMNASLFLGLGKRRKELVHNKESRSVLKDYNEEFLDKFGYLTLTLTIVFYSLWSIDQGSQYLYYTIPLLMIIFMKYCLSIEKNDEGDPTTILFEDKLLLLLCAIYGFSVLFLLICN